MSNPIRRATRLLHQLIPHSTGAIDAAQLSANRRSSPLRLVIIGGVAGGASTAARARRLNEFANIVILEKGPDVSFANCGIPYYISGEINDRSKLAVQTPQSLKKILNIDVRTLNEAIHIDRKAKKVLIKHVTDGSTYELPYDKLVLAPGASPIKPPLENINDPRIFTLRTLSDMDAVKAKLSKSSSQRVLIIGCGFIGLEMAEGAVHLGKQVTMVEGQKHVLPQVDSEFAIPVENELKSSGIRLICGDMLQGFEASSSSSSTITAKLASGFKIEADVVILSIGVKPDSHLAVSSGLKVNHRGAIDVNEFNQTSDPDIYAVGDAVLTKDPILPEVAGGKINLALAGPASRQARTVADHIFLGQAGAKPYPGSIGTAIVRVFDLHVGVTGWTEKRLQEAKVNYRSTIVTSMQHAAWFPAAVPVTVKIVWEAHSGRILGGQAVGCDGVDKRLDVLATAIRGNLTIDSLAESELSYAPPFGASRDVINLAGMTARNIQEKIGENVYQLPTDGSVQLIDVRPREVIAANPIEPLTPQQVFVNIPYDELRDRLHEIDKSRPVITVCSVGKTAYFAMRILKQHGFQVRYHVGGALVLNQRKASSVPIISTTPSPLVAAGAFFSAPVTGIVHLDACGLACPGPLLKVRDAVSTLQPGEELIVKASDAGFAKDLPVFAKQQGLQVISMEKSRGIITGRIRKPAL